MIFLGFLALTLNAGTVTKPSTVLVIRTEASPDAARREQRLYEQLALALDDFAVMLTAPPQAGFADLRLPDQVAIALNEAEASSAVAVAWLVLPAPKQVMVHLVARNTGRTLVKTVEATTGPQAEATLAVVVRELLGTAFLFEPTTTLPASVQSVVKDVRTQAVAPEVNEPAKPVKRLSVDDHLWRATATVSARTLQQLGAPVSAGALVSRRLWSDEHWALSALLQLDLGPFDVRPALFIAELSAGADLFYSFTHGTRFGPFLDLQGGGRIHTAQSGAQGVVAGSASLRGHLGLRVLVPLTASLGFSFELGIGARAFPLVLRLGEETLWREGFGVIRSSLGVTWEGL